MSETHMLGRTLLVWYDAHKRALPWRDEGAGPYRTWVSEIMLQQTRVDTVIPYFERFMGRFPDVHSLADADLDEVLQLWSGLGYYSRARNLHRAAGIVADQPDFPDSVEALRALPGIGEYVAGAIASIALGQDEPTVDGNIHRVFSRVWCRDMSRARMFRAAEAELVPGRAGDFNQALMDLGATICTPRRPSCDRCPLRELCEAARTGRQDRFPEKKKKKVPKRREGVALLLQKGSHTLLVRRPAAGLFGGLYDLPGDLMMPGESSEDCISRVARKRLGLEVRAGAPIAEISHVLTHMRLVLRIYECQWQGSIRLGHYTARKWLRPEEFSSIGLSTLCKKALDRSTP